MLINRHNKERTFMVYVFSNSKANKLTLNIMDRKQSLLEFLEKDPTSSFLRFALAKEYENENNSVKSIETYETLIQTDPAYTGAYYHLGKQYEKNQELDQAIRVYQLGIKICQEQKAWHDASELKGALGEISDDWE